MKRYLLSAPLRVVLFPALALLISSGGVSYALTGNVVPFSSSGVEVVVDTSPPGADVAIHIRTPEASEKPKVDRDDDEATNRTDDENDFARPTPRPRSTQGCPPGFTGNHGEFVSHSDQPRDEAARSDCGKPQHPAPQHPENHGTVERERPEHAQSHEFDDDRGEDHRDGDGNPSGNNHEQDGDDHHDGGPDD